MELCGAEERSWREAVNESLSFSSDSKALNLLDSFTSSRCSVSTWGSICGADSAAALICFGFGQFRAMWPFSPQLKHGRCPGSARGALHSAAV